MANKSKLMQFLFCVASAPLPFSEMDLKSLDPYHYPAQSPLLLLVHGGSGTRKTFFAHSLRQALPPGRISFADTTGVAVAAVFEGRTMHNLISLPLSDSQFHQFSIKNRATVERNLRLGNPKRATLIIVVNEVSMLSACHLSQIADRPCQVGYQQPFAGFGVILMGDFYQLPSVGVKPLYVLSLDLSFNGRSQAQAGADFSRQFQLCE